MPEINVALAPQATQAKPASAQTGPAGREAAPADGFEALLAASLQQAEAKPAKAAPADAASPSGEEKTEGEAAKETAPANLVAQWLQLETATQPAPLSSVPTPTVPQNDAALDGTEQAPVALNVQTPAPGAAQGVKAKPALPSAPTAPIAAPSLALQPSAPPKGGAEVETPGGTAREVASLLHELEFASAPLAAAAERDAGRAEKTEAKPAPDFAALLGEAAKGAPSEPVRAAIEAAKPLIDNVSSSSPVAPGLAGAGLIGEPQRENQQLTHRIAIESPLGSSAWADDAGQKIAFLVGKQVQAAEIIVNPKELGPIEVRISMNQDRADVSFTVTQVETQRAIESALPKLKEMLAENGINLSGASVGREQPRDQRFAAYGEQSGRPANGRGFGAGEALPIPVVVRHSDRLVDVFA